MIGTYLVPNGATWEAQAPELSETGQRTYTAPTGIPARVRAKVKMVRGPTGEAVPTQAEIKTTARVEIGDKVNGREVIALSIPLGLSGAEAWRVVYI